jgi:hypothetical protein
VSICSYINYDVDVAPENAVNFYILDTIPAAFEPKVSYDVDTKMPSYGEFNRKEWVARKVPLREGSFTKHESGAVYLNVLLDHFCAYGSVASPREGDDRSCEGSGNGENRRIGGKKRKREEAEEDQQKPVTKDYTFALLYHRTKPDSIIFRYEVDYDETAPEKSRILKLQEEGFVLAQTSSVPLTIPATDVTVRIRSSTKGEPPVVENKIIIFHENGNCRGNYWKHPTHDCLQLPPSRQKVKLMFSSKYVSAVRQSNLCHSVHLPWRQHWQNHLPLRQQYRQDHLPRSQHHQEHLPRIQHLHEGGRRVALTLYLVRILDQMVVG